MMEGKTIGSRAADTGRLNAKDAVFCAAFGVLLFTVSMVIASVASIDYRAMWFTYAVSSLVTGMIWMYLVRRVPKRGAVLAMGVVIAAAGILMGMFWSGPAGAVVGAIVAELVLGAPEARTKIKMVSSFSVFTTLFWLGHISLVYIIGGDAYIAQCVRTGIGLEYAQGLVAFMYGPWIVVAGVATVACSLIGGMIGLRAFTRHFECMGLR